MAAKPGDGVTYVPERGQVVGLSLNPPAGSEPGGARPALVVSPLQYNRRVGLALVCPLTPLVKGYPFEVALPGGLPVSGAILADQVRSVDWRARLAEYICTLSDDTLREALYKLGVLLRP
jgi:mRNA interferase MazF